jgi:hypothetical protein
MRRDSHDTCRVYGLVQDWRRTELKVRTKGNPAHVGPNLELHIGPEFQSEGGVSGCKSPSHKNSGPAVHSETRACLARLHGAVFFLLQLHELFFRWSWNRFDTPFVKNGSS